MSNRKMYIVTDGGKEIGWGHVVRCLTFYDKFVELGYETELLIDSENECAGLLGKRKYRYLFWHDDITCLNFTRDQTVFLDSLVATQEQTDYLQEVAFCFVVIDDFVRRSYKHALIIDWTPNVENTNEHKHNRTEGNCLLLGLDYSVLRNPFIQDSFYEMRELQTLTVIMGGSDVRNLTVPLTQVICTTFPTKVVNVVLGPGMKECSYISNNVIYLKSLTAEDIKNVFLKSDLVISAGGQTLFELAALRVPVIPIQVANNQKEDVEGLAALGFFDEIYQWNDPFLLKYVAKKIRQLEATEARKKYIEKFQVVKIGSGLSKIINCIQKQEV